MSINTLNEKFKNDMDNASSIKDRLETLKKLHENGIYTVLFMSPIFPYITDFKKKLETAEQKSMKHENEDQSKLSEEDLKKLNRDSDYWFKKIETVKHPKV